MAEVLIANATGIEGFERYVVLKRIHSSQAGNKSFVQMFLDEARLAASLHHQHIVQVHDIGQDNGEYFFTMEYIHGEDLRHILQKVASRKQQVPIEHVLTIVIAAASALHYAHEHRGADRTPLNIVHRDISPSNILVGFDGSIKVVDFGIAKAATRTDQTKSGVLKGKVAYMSPEQCRGKSVDRRCDVYALGIVLYELLTARRLFKADSDFMTMSAIVASRIPPPSTRRPGLAPELEAIVLKALAKTTSDRYQTADEMRRALEQYASSAGIRTSTTALGDYLLQLFGPRAMPWEIDSEISPPAELTIDFDGSATGIADVPTDPFEEGFSDSGSSPIGKARTNAITASPPLDAETTPSPGARRGRWLAPVVLATVLIGGVVAWKLASSDEPAPSTAPASATAGSERPEEPPPAPERAPIVTGAVVEPPLDAGVAADAAPVTKKKASGTKRPVAKKQNQPKTPDVEWDPDTLIPQ